MLRAGGEKEFLVRAIYLEIYNEDIRDLLSKVRMTGQVWAFPMPVASLYRAHAFCGCEGVCMHGQ